MRQAAALGVGLLIGLLAGCASGSGVHSTSWLKRRQPFHGPTGPDVVRMEIALLECPVGDSYINLDLWKLADEQVVPLENKAALEDNGFRVGQVGGIIPDELQELLTSKRSNVNPRERQVMGGYRAELNLGPVLAQCSFILQEDGQPVTVSLDQARCRLTVVPRMTPDGKAQLHFTPEIEYGEQVPDFHPAEDGSGWVMQVQRPCQTYPALGWDVTLEPNQYLVVGARFDQPRSLGYACFVQADAAATVQRLLVIRTSRAGTPTEPDAGADTVCSRQAPPLALQVQTPWTTARGSQP
jgi:hypothetical protein